MFWIRFPKMELFNKIDKIFYLKILFYLIYQFNFKMKFLLLKFKK